MTFQQWFDTQDPREFQNDDWKHLEMAYNAGKQAIDRQSIEDSNWQIDVLMAEIEKLKTEMAVYQERLLMEKANK